MQQESQRSEVADAVNAFHYPKIQFIFLKEPIMTAILICMLFTDPAVVPQDSVPKDAGLFVQVLELFHSRGTPMASDSAYDFQLKTTIAKALSKDSNITHSEVEDFMSAEDFKLIAKGDDRIEKNDVVEALKNSSPASRMDLIAKLRTHAEYLTTTFDMIDDQHRVGAEKLASWIASHYEPGKTLDVIVVCTGNSRRSILGASMGNLAAAYYGIPNVRFHSGGTNPTAFNPRTIAALKDIGFEIEGTGTEALQGDAKTPNPIYRVRWGTKFEATEFSKHYSDDCNPQSGFAALMVCTEADVGCPLVKGAAIRISMPYLDPKTYDDSLFESAKYAERRDDIGRMMLSVMCPLQSKIAVRQ